MTRQRICLAALVLLALLAILVPFAEARYYHPTLGRFINRDPNEYVDGLNLYNYTGNNPIILTDPMGGCSGPPPQVDYCIVESVEITDNGADDKEPGWLLGSLSWRFDVDITICGNPRHCKLEQEGFWRRFFGGAWRTHAFFAEPNIKALERDAMNSYERLDGYRGRLTYSDRPGIYYLSERYLPAYHHDTITARVIGSDGRSKEDAIECGPHSLPKGFTPPAYEVWREDVLRRIGSGELTPGPEPARVPQDPTRPRRRPYRRW